MLMLVRGSADGIADTVAGCHVHLHSLGVARVHATGIACCGTLEGLLPARRRPQGLVVGRKVL